MRGSVDEMVCGVVAAHLEVQPADITVNKSFFDDLGIPPLGVVLIALDIEDLEGISLPFERLLQIRTVADLCALVRGLDAQPVLN